MKLLEFVLGLLLACAWREGMRPFARLRLGPVSAPIANVLGDSSYALYLTHVYVIWRLGFHSMPLSILGAVIISVIIFYAVERPATMLLRRLRPRATPRVVLSPAISGLPP
jgi:peptidoglycan/LPS O-acetylase OafA/YrhL